ncbi:MAG: hypothetical protein RIR48_2347, partial [Bacteroidota bacterium]
LQRQCRKTQALWQRTQQVQTGRYDQGSAVAVKDKFS